MRVVIAPDKFKGTASAAEIANAIAQPLRDVGPGAETAYTLKKWHGRIMVWMVVLRKLFHE